MIKELAKVYDPSVVEERLYTKWCEKKYFHAEVDKSKKPFSIVMPPPNITGQLHMGHALDNTIQDILIRWKRMSGYNTLWVPGIDHASISTEVKVVAQLAKEGLIARLRTERIIKSDIIWSYINAQDLGQNVDSRIKLYNDAQNMTLKDVTDFQKKWIKGRTYTYCILGDKKELDMEKLKEVGPIRELTQEEIFGY